MIEFDRRHAHDYKVYNIPVTEEFKHFIEINTGYTEANRHSSTDIKILCEKICGVNLSVGYYYEHTEFEHLEFHEWENTLNITRKMLEPEQHKFFLNPKKETFTQRKIRIQAHKNICRYTAFIRLIQF